MSNEIKEISDKIKKCLIAGYDVDIITQDELNILWNYITNLQQELERYKHYSKTTGIEELMQENERLKDIVVEKDSQIKEMILQKTDYTAVNILEMKLEDYKSRVEKAIEYITSYEAISTIQGLDKIEQNKKLDERTMNVIVERYLKVHHNLLNILQGGKDE